MKKFLVLLLSFVSVIALADAPVIWSGTTAKWLPSGLNSVGLGKISATGILTSGPADLSNSAEITGILPNANLPTISASSIVSSAYLTTVATNVQAAIEELTTGLGAKWGLTGNSGTTAGTNFLGTTDAQDLVFKTNGAQKLRIVDATSSYIFGAGAAATARYNITFDEGATRYIGVADSSAGIGNNLQLFAGSPSPTAGLSDTNGGDLYLNGGDSIGTGVSNIYFRTAPAGASGTATNTGTYKMAITGEGSVGIGTLTPTAMLQVSPGTSLRSGTIGASANFFLVNTGTFTDTNTAASGTASYFNGTGFLTPTISASNTGVTTTEASVIKVSGGVIAGTNETIGSTYGIDIKPTAVGGGGGAVGKAYGMKVSTPTGATNNYAAIFNGTGYVGFGMTDPTSPVDIAAISDVVGTSEQINLRSKRTSIVSGELVGGISMTSNDPNTTAPGVKVAMMDAVAEASHTASVLDTGLAFYVTSVLTMAEKMRLSAAGFLGIGTTTPGSTLHVAGSYQGAMTTITTNTTLDSTHQDVAVDTTAGAVTVTLPNCVTAIIGRKYTLKKIDASANAVNVARTGATNTFDGNTSDSFSEPWRTKTYKCISTTLWGIY